MGQNEAEWPLRQIKRRGALDHEASSATGTRARVARVRVEYPDQLGYSGVDLAQRSLNDISSTPEACASPQSIPPEHGATVAAHRAGAPPFLLKAAAFGPGPALPEGRPAQREAGYACSRSSDLAPEHHSAGTALPGFPCF